MKQLLSRAVTLSVWGMLATGVSAVPLVNASFESPNVSASFTSYNAGDTTLTGWIIGAAGVDHIGSYWVAQDGSQSIDLNGLNSGTLSQSFATVIGQTYFLTFFYANNPDGLANGFPVESGTVSVDGVGNRLNQTVFHSGSTNAAMDWTRFTGSFVADSLVTTLTFTGGSTGAYGLALDNVSVTEAPEIDPASSTLPFTLLMGLALVGAGRRQRRLSTACPG